MGSVVATTNTPDVCYVCVKRKLAKEVKPISGFSFMVSRAIWCFINKAFWKLKLAAVLMVGLLFTDEAGDPGDPVASSILMPGAAAPR